MGCRKFFCLTYTLLYLRYILIFGYSKFNFQNMIEQTFYFALAANWLMQNPAWQSLIAPQWVPNPNYDNPHKHNEEETREQYWHKERAIHEYDRNTPSTIQVNFFARKPFTCLYCITFWLVVLFAAAYTAWYHYLPTTWGVCVTAPVVAVAFDRWFKSLPVKF